MNKQKMTKEQRLKLIKITLFGIYIPLQIAMVFPNEGGLWLKNFFWTTLFPFAVVLAAVYIISTLVFCTIFKNKDFQFAKFRTEIFEQKDKLADNYKGFRAKNTLLTIFAKCYLWSFVIILVLINIATIADLVNYLFVGEFENIFSLCFLIVFIFNIRLLGFLFITIDDSIEGLHMYLPQNEYPQIWDAAITAKIKLGIKGKLAIFAVPGTNVGITLHKKTQVLLVGVDTPRMLNKAELYAVFIHEFGHAVNKDTRMSRRRQILSSKLETLSSKRKLYPSFLFIPICIMISKSFYRFSLLTSYLTEKKADKIITNSTDVHNFINAVAKLDLFNLWLYELPKQNFYSSKEPLRDYFEYRFNCFKTAYLKNKRKWEHICLNQLEARIDTHPNLPERMRVFDVSEFTAEFELDERLVKEVAKLENTIWLQISNEWEKSYRNEYLRHQETISEWNSLQPQHNYAVLANAYFCICDYDNALKYYDIVLNENPSHAEALFRKGLILCDRYDNSGIDYLYKSASDMKYGEMAFARLGAYLQYMSLSEQREKLRNGMYSKIDANLHANISKKFKIKPHTLPDDIFIKIKNCVNSEIKTFSNSYLVNKQVSQRNINCLYLCIRNNVDEPVVMQALQNIDETISSLGVTVSFYIYSNVSQMGKLFKALKSYAL